MVSTNSLDGESPGNAAVMLSSNTIAGGPAIKGRDGKEHRDDHKDHRDDGKEHHAVPTLSHRPWRPQSKVVPGHRTPRRATRYPVVPEKDPLDKHRTEQRDAVAK